MNTIQRSLVACALAALCASASAQAQTNKPAGMGHAPMQNVVELAAQGETEVPNDWLTLTLVATREAPDAATTQTQLRQALDAALVEARKQAAEDQMEVRTGAFGLSPRYGKDGKIVGWQGRAELVLEGRDFTRIGNTATKLPTMAIQQVDMGLSRSARTKAEATAQAEAITKFKAQAQSLSTAFGFTGYTLREVAVNTGAQQFRPRQFAEAKAMLFSASSDGGMPIEPGKGKVTVTVAGSVQMR